MNGSTGREPSTPSGENNSKQDRGEAACLLATVLLYIETPTLDVKKKKAYSYTDDRKTPFDRMSCGLPTATKISKGGHSRSERHPQSITHKMEL